MNNPKVARVICDSVKNVIIKKYSLNFLGGFVFGYRIVLYALIDLYIISIFLGGSLYLINDSLGYEVDSFIFINRILDTKSISKLEEILKELDWILTYKTPIVPLSDNSNNLYVKKEECIPFSFGGNKCRIAASYFKELISKDCDVVITYGASSSNLCRVIANMASRYNVQCVIVTPDELSEATCNSEMVEFLGAKRVKCPLDNVAGTIDTVIEEYKKTNNPYFIYGGGHGVLGTESYRDVIRQIDEYEKDKNTLINYFRNTLFTSFFT